MPGTMDGPMGEGARLLGGKYAVVRLLGEGGMGAVYEARNTWTDRRVAVKLLRPELAAHGEAVARFLQEAKAITRIAHRNIVDVLDMGADPADGALFIVQEYLEGQDLRAHLLARGSLPPREAVSLLLPVLDALAFAHARGVVHRDLKPANIFLARGPQGELVPKLIDFGISKVLDAGEGLAMTRTGVALGTPYYMSPEQASGEPTVDGRSDVWSAGAVLFELLSGRCPFDAPNYNKLILLIATERPPRIEAFLPGVPALLADVLHRALERDLARRYPTMQAFADDLRALGPTLDVLPSQSLPAAPVSAPTLALETPPPRLTPPTFLAAPSPARAKPSPLARAGALALVLLAAGGAFALASGRASHRREGTPPPARTASPPSTPSGAHRQPSPSPDAGLALAPPPAPTLAPSTLAQGSSPSRERPRPGGPSLARRTATPASPTTSPSTPEPRPPTLAPPTLAPPAPTTQPATVLGRSSNGALILDPTATPSPPREGPARPPTGSQGALILAP